MSDEKDLQKARASAAADDDRRGLLSFGEASSDKTAPTEPSLAVRTRDLLRRYDLRARKSLGQNFLINGSRVTQIADSALQAARLAGAETILEVGPGLGALTVALAVGGAPRVIAFEVDRSMQAPLGELLGPHPQVTVHFEDFLQADLRRYVGSERFVVAGNLPYNITAPLLEKLLTDPQCLAMVITVQKEVASRLRADPGSKAYGPLTLFCQYHVQAVEVVTQLHPGDFLPPPQVDSTALRLVRRQEPPFAEPSAEVFEMAVRSAFNHRRKSLRSGLPLATRLGMTREQVQDALDRAGISGDRRAETLDLAEFARLGQALSEVASDA